VNDGPSHRLALRPATGVLFGVAALLVFLSVATQNPVPLFAAVPLLLAPIAASGSAPPPDARTDLRWSVEGSADEVLVRGSIRPSESVTTDSLEVRFFRPEPLVVTAPAQVNVTSEAIDFLLSWKAPYPLLANVPRPEIVWRDPLSLVEVSLPVETPALRIERYPPEVARLGSVRLPRTTPQPGEIRSRQIGSSGEFFAVRLAAPTDTPRQINWRATARAGHLLANDFHLERTGDLILLLDLRPTSLGAERDATILAVSKAAALGIASGFLAEKARVGLGTFDEFLNAVPLGSGRRHRYRIAQALSRAEMTDGGGPSERFGVLMRRYYPPGVTTVLFSALADDESLSLLSHLRRRGFPTVVLSPSPIPLLTPTKEATTPEDLAALRLIRLVRRWRIGEAWREGPVVDWPDYWSLAPFVRYLSAPSIARRGSA
jgi:uncharacterized protein (DUF58 family)